jgi:hypothetical protein
MMPFFGARREQWTNTFEASQAVLGNRGPTFDVVGTKMSASYRLAKTGAVNTNAGFTDTIGKGTSSISLLIHGGRTTWEGNVAFSDNSVHFLTQADPTEYPFTFSGLTASKKGKRRENFFVAENDATLTPLPTQIGRMSVGDTAATNPLTTTNNWLRTWTVSGVAEDATTSEVTVVMD